MTASRLARPVRAMRRAPARRPRLPSDATVEPDPGPPPEAVFDRVTGPYARGAALGVLGVPPRDEAP